MQHIATLADVLTLAFVHSAYPEAIKQAQGKFYYENADIPAARFTFDSWEEAALDFALEIDVSDQERALIATAAETAAERDRLKTRNAELLAALKSARLMLNAFRD